ncbi:MAG: right-handed parallel beta-helix repeat-containing protein, partial [Paludibacter sp.]
LKAGETAYVRGGTYNERFTFTNSGTEGNYITITAYPGETPIIDGTKLGNVYLVSLGSKNYIKISGLRVQNGYIGIGSSGSNVIIENNYVYNFSNMGIWLSYCKNSIVKGNIVDKTVYTSWGECIAITQCEYIDVCYNEVKNGSPTNTAGGEGIDVMGSKHVRVFSNIVHDLPKKLGIYIDAYDGLDYDIQVFNNKVFNCTNGIVISSEKWNDMEKVWVYNNLTYDMIGGEGIKVVDYFNTNYRIKNIIIENNTMSACKGISIDAPNGSDFIIRNNLFYNCSSNIVLPAPPTNLIIANNLSNSGSVSGIGAILADPQFTDPTAKDFTLKSGSPAIDKGASNNVPFDYNYKTRLVGNGIEIGAYEFGATDLVELPTISKPTFTLAKSTVNQSTDDGTQNTSTGVVTLTTTTLSTNFTTTASKIITALRFTNVAVPKGATIINARIKVKTSAACNAGNEAIKIDAERSSNTQTLTADANSISTKPRTVNAAYWLPGNITTVGSLINSPCLDFVVNELVSNSNWVSGNAMTFIFEYMAGAGKT